MTFAQIPQQGFERALKDKKFDPCSEHSPHLSNRIIVKFTPDHLSFNFMNSATILLHKFQG